MISSDNIILVHSHMLVDQFICQRVNQFVNLLNPVPNHMLSSSDPLCVVDGI